MMETREKLRDALPPGCRLTEEKKGEMLKPEIMRVRGLV